MTKIKRNEVCPCGSGKKYKKCCLLKETFLKKMLSPEDFKLKWVPKHKINDKMTLIGIVNVDKAGRELRPAIRIVHFQFDDRKNSDTAISVATQMFGSDIVAVSDGFDSLPDLLKEATIWHEVGHFYNDHFSEQHHFLKQRVDYITDGGIHPREIEADQFVINKVGKKVLEALLDFMLQRNCYESNTKKEVEMRLARLCN